jgi:DedD protein
VSEGTAALREETRYRVTGSLFLLALAVICLPMLLDGAGLPARDLPALDLSEPLPELPAVADQAPRDSIADRVEVLRSQTDDDGFLQDSGTRLGEPVLTRADARTEVWAVQVASFSDAANAEAFRERLRGDGYEAFISTARDGGRVLSRVAVGPLIERERAERLRQELSTRYSTAARLMAFSN